VSCPTAASIVSSAIAIKRIGTMIHERGRRRHERDATYT
jgi:hypothetical protein